MKSRIKTDEFRKELRRIVRIWFHQLFAVRMVVSEKEKEDRVEGRGW